MSELLLSTLAKSVLRSNDDFFGVVDDENTTLQFMKESRGIWAEIPAPSESGSYGAIMTLDVVVKILEKLPPKLSVSLIPNARFEAW